MDLLREPEINDNKNIILTITYTISNEKLCNVARNIPIMRNVLYL